MRRARIEVLTVGQNDNLQLVGSDPGGGAYDIGLPIGANGGPQTPSQRQLFMLAAKTFNAGQRGRLVGFRELLVIGVQITSPTPNATYLLERPVVTPNWKYVDGNVLWGIRQLNPGEDDSVANAQNSNGSIFGFSATPAQLFETIVGNVITPPNGGSFPGNVLNPELGRMFDLRCTDWGRPVECDIPFEGPCTIAFFASVQQTNPSTRTAPPVPTGGGANPFLTTQGTVPEDSFVQWYPGTTYQRIAGSLIFEMEEQAPTGAPKTYRRPGDADRITRDTTETGDNTMRRSAEDTSQYDACDPGGPGDGPPGQGQHGGPHRPASPPHPNAPSSFAGLPKIVSESRVIQRIVKQWRLGKPPRGSR